MVILGATALPKVGMVVIVFFLVVYFNNFLKLLFLRQLF